VTAAPLVVSAFDEERGLMSRVASHMV
jgi:hypothetical protein